MSKYRPTEFHYYEWDFNLWFGSETRARCRALASDLPMGLLANAAEGAYRNLMDYCYKQGDIPGDVPGMAALCGMSPEVFELVWPVFRNKFSAHKSRPGRLVHENVAIRLRALRNRSREKSLAGRAGALKRWANKPPQINGMDGTTMGDQWDPNGSIWLRNRNKEVGNRKPEETSAAAVAAAAVSSTNAAAQQQQQKPTPKKTTTIRTL